MNHNKPETVVFIHGLFMNGWDMGLLRKRIAEAGYTTHQFSYNSVGSNVEQIIGELADFIQSLDASVVHYVCHSLGGLVVRHYLNNYPDAAPGKIVTLGTPHNGSDTAKFINQYNVGSLLLGRSLEAGLLGNAPEWNGERDLGVIAGDIGLGLGILFKGLETPNDGTVAVEETKLQHCADHLCMRVSHTGLLISKTVATETVNFLANGRFGGE